MQLSVPVKRFIEDNVVLLEEEEYTLFFYLALFNLPHGYGEELISICKYVLNVDTDTALQNAMVVWCKDDVALKHRKKVQLNSLQQILPDFGYNSSTFRRMLVDAIKTAYPNKTVLPDSYGIEYVVEKQ